MERVVNFQVARPTRRAPSYVQCIMYYEIYQIEMKPPNLGLAALELTGERLHAGWNFRIFRKAHSESRNYCCLQEHVDEAGTCSKVYDMMTNQSESVQDKRLYLFKLNQKITGKVVCLQNIQFDLSSYPILYYTFHVCLS